MIYEWLGNKWIYWAQYANAVNNSYKCKFIIPTPVINICKVCFSNISTGHDYTKVIHDIFKFVMSEFVFNHHILQGNTKDVDRSP